MRTAEEKILFKNHFFKLGQSRIIRDTDSAFWVVFTTISHTPADTFDSITAFDIQTVRDQNLPNFLSLLRFLAKSVSEFATQFALGSEAPLLNTVRFLTKLLPYIYELPNYVLDIEQKLFWSDDFDSLLFLPFLKPTLSVVSPSDDGAPGPDLVLGLVALLFQPEFTHDSPGLWEPGLLLSAPYRESVPLHDARRVEILRLLIALCSKPMYNTIPEIAERGLLFTSYLVSCIPEESLLKLTLSLLNTLCRASSAKSGLDSEKPPRRDIRYVLTYYSAFLLSLMVTYPAPAWENISILEERGYCPHKPKNTVKSIISSIDQEPQLRFVASSLLNQLRRPMLAEKEILTFSWNLECMVLLWELLECNSNFQQNIALKLIPRLVPCLLFFVFTYHTSALHVKTVKIAVHFLLHTCSNPDWSKLLITPLEERTMSTFSLEYRLKSPGTLRDFVVQQICHVLSFCVVSNGASKVSGPVEHKRRFLVTSLVEILYDIVPVVNESLNETDIYEKRMQNANPKGGLSILACSALMNLILRLSTPQYLSADPRNGQLLALLIRAIVAAAVKQPQASRMLLFAIFRNQRTFEGLQTLLASLDKESEELAEPLDSEIAPLNDSLMSPKISNTEHLDLLENSIASFSLEEEPEGVDTYEENLQDSIDFELRPAWPAGMSKRAHEKLARGSLIAISWGGNGALLVINDIILPFLKSQIHEQWLQKDLNGFDSYYFVCQIEHSGIASVFGASGDILHYDLHPLNPVDVLKISWNNSSLGWYLSALYSDLYFAPDKFKSAFGLNKSLVSDISSSLASFGRLASSWSGLGGGGQPESNENIELNEYLASVINSSNIWASTAVKLFNTQTETDKGYFGLKFPSQSQPEPAGSLNRRISDFRSSSRASVTTIGSLTHQDDFDNKLHKRNSVTSLHSLNTLNRTRSNTPRNSISM